MNQEGILNYLQLGWRLAVDTTEPKVVEGKSTAKKQSPRHQAASLGTEGGSQAMKA